MLIFTKEIQISYSEEVKEELISIEDKCMALNKDDCVSNVDCNYIEERCQISGIHVINKANIASPEYIECDLLDTIISSECAMEATEDGCISVSDEMCQWISKSS